MSEHLVRTSLLENETVLRLILDSPPGNVLTMAMVSALGEALAKHRDRPNLRMVLIRGAGSNFSFGASVEEHRKDQAPKMLHGFHRFLRQLAAFPVPTAALVEGNCLGGGLELVLCCHFVFAVEGARFACPEIKLGVFPPLLAAIGASRLGGPLTDRLLLTGETIGADDAQRAGLLAMAPIAADTAKETVIAWYRKRLLPLSACALRQGTTALRQATAWLATLDTALDATEKQYIAEVLASHDGNEGIEAFLEKRPPAWLDR